MELDRSCAARTRQNRRSGSRRSRSRNDLRARRRPQASMARRDRNPSGLRMALPAHLIVLAAESVASFSPLSIDIPIRSVRPSVATLILPISDTEVSAMAELPLVIQNGEVITGTRMPRFRGDVGIKNGRIARIGRL